LFVVVLAVVLLGLALKLVLLVTSQSLADGDEAVEGVMAMHILEHGEHPIYPYGANYGAGAGVEAHLAALSFAVFGPSDGALKAVGLVFWVCTLVLLGLLSGQVGDRSAAAAAVVLFAVCPSGSQWGLKVAGGHQVAICLSLLAAWLALGERRWVGALLVAPAAVLAHPIVAPFIAALCVMVIWRRKGVQRGTALLLLLGASLVWALLLWPPARTFHDPSSDSLALGERFLLVPQLALGLFCPNLNLPDWPSGLSAVVAVLWLGCYLAALVQLRRLPGFWVYALAPWGVLLMVDPLELAPRHLLLLVPLSCLFLGVWASKNRRLALGFVPVLVLTGLVMHVRESTDPFVYGPAEQSLGLERENIRGLVKHIEESGTHHIYCSQEMLAWSLMFESRGRLLVRSKSPRIPEIARQVDAARRAGQPVGLILANRQRPVRYAVLFYPNPRIIEEHFPPLRDPPTAR
jgi:hypothetical protein